MQWKMASSLSSITLKVTLSASKAMLTAFSDCKRVILAEFTKSTRSSSQVQELLVNPNLQTILKFVIMELRVYI